MPRSAAETDAAGSQKGTQCILMHVNDRSSKMMGAGLVVPKSAAETDAAGSQYTY